MTKSELKNGMVVELRNGNRYLVHNDKFIRNKRYTRIDNFNNELLFSNKPEYDIIKVYKSNAMFIEDLFDNFYLCLIWERKEQPKLSEMDKKVIKKGLKKAQEYCKSLISCKDCEFHEGAYCKFDCFSMSTDLDEFLKISKCGEYKQGIKRCEMTIDEAIKIAKDQAEENRNEAYTTSIPWHAKDCERWAEENEQVAHWLEELKEYKKLNIVHCKDCKHWGTGVPGETEYAKCCECGGYMVGANGYCVYGEKECAE